MNPAKIKFPFHCKKRKAKRVAKTVKERVQKYREKLKHAGKKVKQEAKERKKEENKRFKEKRKLKVKTDEAFRKGEKIRKAVENRKNYLKRKRKRQQEENQQQEKQARVQFDPKPKKDNPATRKRVQRLRKRLPNSPSTWVETVSHLIKNSTPRRKQGLMSEISPDSPPSAVDPPQEINLRKVGRPRKEFSNTKRILVKAAVDKENLTAAQLKSMRRYLRRDAQVKPKNLSKLYNHEWQPSVNIFLEENSRIMPNKRDTMVIMGKRVAKRHLLITKKQAYNQFKATHPNYKKKYRTFCKAIPKNIRRLKMSDRRVCVCEKCYNLEQRVDALKRVLGRGVERPTLKSLSDMTLCPYEKFPSRKCVDRRCDDCGTAKLIEKFQPLVSNNNNTAKWHEWRHVEQKSRNKKKKKVWLKKRFTANPEDLLKKIAEGMEWYSSHDFRRNYQYNFVTQLLERLPLNQAYLAADFSQNMSLAPQDEIESKHWDTPHATLHPVYVVRHEKESTVEKPKYRKESHIILSNEETHDARAVYAFIRHVIKFIQDNPGPEKLRRVKRITDNCCVQYKCAEAFSHMVEYSNQLDVDVDYNFTEPGHGKNVPDGIGATTKQMMARLILSEQCNVNNAYEAYLVLNKYMPKLGEEEDFRADSEGNSYRYVHYVPSQTIQRVAPKKCGFKTIVGTQKLRSVSVARKDPLILRCQDLSSIPGVDDNQHITVDELVFAKTGKVICILEKR